jgi:hypothetical protein
MAASRTTFEKLQRDRAKQAKAAAKRARRLEKNTEAPEDDTPVDVGTDGATKSIGWALAFPPRSPSLSAAHPCARSCHAHA